MRLLLCVLFLFAAAPSAHAAAELPPPAMAEIEGLLGILGSSDCQFYRNGTWYDGAEAKSHLRMKYEYLARKRLLHSTEDFIKGAGEKSSLSGEPYRVRCPGQLPQPSAEWLQQRLRQMRVVHQDAKP